MKALIKKCTNSGVLASLALALTAMTANSCCHWIFGQSEEPDAVKALRKF
ncbi:MAG: cyclic lactone autoinducer peptide [Lachnospiraceae bacterium]|nr:cyclic lactone autoinducer peptide [Lachnospiraceae bacterium]